MASSSRRGWLGPCRSSATRSAFPPSRPRTRADLAYATGFAHAQDRFFQMDLSRRLAAGELTELFGAVAARTGCEERACSTFAASRGGCWSRPRLQQRSVGGCVRARRERRPGEPAQPALGILGAALAARRSGGEKTRFSSCTPCGGICSTRASGASSCGARSTSARAGRSPPPAGSGSRAFSIRRDPRWDAPNEAAGVDGFFAFNECAAIPGADELNVRAAVQSAPLARSRRAAKTSPGSSGSNNWALAGSLDGQRRRAGGQ